MKLTKTITRILSAIFLMPQQHWKNIALTNQTFTACTAARGNRIARKFSLICISQQVYNLVIFFVWKSFTYSYWRHYQPISSHLSSIEEENNLGHILYIFISLTLGRVQVFCQILSNERGFKKLMLYGNVTQIVLFLYWAKMTANWLVVSPVRVCERFSYKKYY